MTKICLNCNKKYVDSAKFCENCGAQLSENTSVTGILNRAIEKHDNYNEEKMKKSEDENFAKKMANRTATEREYGFFYDDITEIYKQDAKKADKVYKAYVTGGISRIEKVNGRFLASQLIKLEVINQQNNRIIGQNNEIIEQNDEIIKLLREIARK